MLAKAKIVGREIDIVHKIADRIGVPRVGFGGIDSIIAAGAGKADLRQWLHDQRRTQGKVDFSDPFIVSVQYPVIPENSPIAKVEDLLERRSSPERNHGIHDGEDAINKGISRAREPNSSPTTMRLTQSSPRRMDRLTVSSSWSPKCSPENPHEDNPNGQG